MKKVVLYKAHQTNKGVLIMYNENGFSLKNVIVKIVLVLLFIFLLLWFFPMPKMEPVYDRIFLSNIESMKDAAKDYFTLERLPKNVGDKEKLTLADMLKLKLVLPFVDSNNKACDNKLSYVEVTKLDDEYTMKVNLSCGEVSDYIIVHMGCYDYCKTTICEKDTAAEVIKKPVIVKPVPVKPTPVKPVVSYIYEYKKTMNGYYTDWSAWSAWSTTAQTASTNKEVQTKVETTYTEQTKLVAYKTTTSYQDVYEPVSNYLYTVTTKTCTAFGVEYNQTDTTTYKYTEWTYQGIKNYTYTPKDTDTTKYVYVEGSSGDYDCGTCSSASYASYKVYTRQKIAVVEGTVVCTDFTTTKKDLYVITEKYVGTATIKKTEPVYGIVKTPVNTTYYSTRTRSYVEGSTSIKWSYYGDKSLLNSGYSYTGNKKVK